jgi:hypothetical protein
VPSPIAFALYVDGDEIHFIHVAIDKIRKQQVAKRRGRVHVAMQ